MNSIQNILDQQQDIESIVYSSLFLLETFPPRYDICIKFKDGSKKWSHMNVDEIPDLTNKGFNVIDKKDRNPLRW